MSCKECPHCQAEVTLSMLGDEDTDSIERYLPQGSAWGIYDFYRAQELAGVLFAPSVFVSPDTYMRLWTLVSPGQRQRDGIRFNVTLVRVRHRA